MPRMTKKNPLNPPLLKAEIGKNINLVNQCLLKNPPQRYRYLLYRQTFTAVNYGCNIDGCNSMEGLTQYTTNVYYSMIYTIVVYKSVRLSSNYADDK